MIEYKLCLAGTECCVAEWNPDAKVTCFGFHGWLDNLATFESLMQYLPEIHFVAIDFPGHGRSSHISAGETYYFIDGLFLIDDLIEHFKLEKVNLLGHSMGGAIASLYAAAQPSRINKLALIESLGPITSPAAEVKNGLAKAVTLRRSLKSKRKPVYATFEQALMARAEVSEIAPALIQPLVERALTAVNGGFTWRADSRLRIQSALRMAENQLREVISNIKAPTLLMEGSRGLLRTQMASYVQERKPLVANLQCHILEGGHHLHLQNPKSVAELVQAFLLN